jgi:hypothetical protein
MDMPTNAENIQRGSVQTSFDFTPQGQYQAQSGETGASGAGGLVGGNITGGSNDPALQGEQGLRAGVGGFLDSVLKPYAEREAANRFAQGMTDQMYAGATKELYHSDSPLTKIFGPSSYQQGAQAYMVQARTASAMSSWQARMPDLEKLSPNQVAPEFVKHMQSAMTGDATTDHLITQEMLKQSPSMLQSVAKASYALSQKTAQTAQATAWDKGGDTLQVSMAQAAASGNPEDQVSAQVAIKNYADGLVDFYGQDPQAKLKNLTNVIMMQAQKGNGYAVKVLVARPEFQDLDPKDRIKIVDAIDKYGNRAVSKAAMDPSIVSAIDEVDILLSGMDKAVSPDQVVNGMAAINAKISQATGVDTPFFDAGAYNSGMKSVWQARKAQSDKDEARAWERYMQGVRHSDELDTVKQKAAMATQDAAVAAASDNPTGKARAMGVDSSRLEEAVGKLWDKGNLPQLDVAFRSGTVASGVVTANSNIVATQIGTGYGEGFDQTNDQFNKVLRQNPALAKAYYGANYPQFMQYNALISAPGADKVQAFSRAFGDPRTLAVSAGTKDAVNKKLVADIQSQQPGFWSKAATGFGLWGTAPVLTDSSQRTLANALTNEVAVDANNANGMSFTGQWDAAKQVQISSGQMEQYGKYLWAGQRKGTEPLYHMMGITQDEATHLIPEIIDSKLRGFNASPSNDVLFYRQYQGNKTILHVQPTDERGAPIAGKGFIIDEDTLKNEATEFRKAKMDSSQAAYDAAAKAGLNPYRRITGEGNGRRIIRINREIQAGSPMGGRLWPQGQQPVVTGNEPWAK